MPPREKSGKAKELKAAPVSTAPEVQGGTRDVETGFPVVDITASAGGLAAIEAFFAAMPGAPRESERRNREILESTRRKSGTGKQEASDD